MCILDIRWVTSLVDELELTEVEWCERTGRLGGM
jgi:hypothetical protein